MNGRSSNSSATPLRPEPEVVHICIIDADPIFSKRLSALLAEVLPKMVNVFGTFEGIPDILEVPYEMGLVIFDPELDDFRQTGEAINRMRDIFGEKAYLAVHADFWKTGDSPLRRDLQMLDVWYGFGRNDLRRCIELVTKIAMREPLESWHWEFVS